MTVRLSGTKLLLLLCIIPLAAAALARPAVAAPSASPAWQVTIRSTPTVLPRSGEMAPADEAGNFLLIATNLGGTATSDPVTVAITFPAGVEPKVEGGFFPFLVNRSGNQNTIYPCDVAAQVVTCEAPENIPAGESLMVEVPSRVSLTAPATVVTTAVIEGGGAAAVSASTSTEIGTQIPPFDFLPGESGLSAQFSDADGLLGGLAGEHPYQLTFNLGFPAEVRGENLQSVGELKDVHVSLPRGLYVNPNAVKEKCTENELGSDLLGGPGCPPASQVGTALNVASQVGWSPARLGTKPVYAMKPAPGFPAELAFDAAEGVYVHLFGHVAADGEYEIVSAVSNIPGKLNPISSLVTLWGNPTDESHDRMRGWALPGPGCIGLSPAEMIERERTCAVDRVDRSLLTLPSDCPSRPLEGLAEIASWQEPAVRHSRTFSFTGLDGQPVSTTGCNQLEFSPSISSKATTNHADSPTGLEFNLHQPQSETPEGRATANLKDAVVTLPAGVAINPASANGQDVCTEEQMGYAPKEGKIRFAETPQSCPNGAKIGFVEVTTPLLEHPLNGAVYVAKPFDNPFDSLLAIYLALEDEETGVISKLAGRVSPDPQTGQLTTTFTENPELPLEDIHLRLFQGPSASLKTGFTCGTYTTTSSLVPWSTPEGATVHPLDSFDTNLSASGSGSCPGSEGAAPFAPAFTAGTVNPTAGVYSPFTLRLVRRDGEQHITGIDTTLPGGLIGKLAGIPYCSEAQIAAAQGREVPQQGRAEQASPSCPSASEVGTVTVGAGAGTSPYYVTGHAYMAGPYKGAPLSLVTIVPAVAGPFDLGTVVSRVALYVGEYDARIHAVSDPLPTIRAGIPLDVRSIEVKLDRPSFTLNPTSCEAKAINGSIGSEAGQTATVNNRFQVGECGRLGFKPTLKLSLKGATKRTGHPALKAVLTYPKKGEYANIARAQVSLPHAEFLDQGNIGQACTKVLLSQHACPARSIYGKVKAWTPLLEAPLEGPVYLVGGYGYKLPALVAELDGQIRVLLVGKVDTGRSKGIRNTFEAVPDAPVERFVLEIKGGKKYGLLENSENICMAKKAKRRANVRFTGQNGAVSQQHPVIQNSCGRKKSHAKKHKSHSDKAKAHHRKANGAS